jgi:hypothetical protein
MLVAAGPAGCAKKNIDAASEVPGAVRWFSGVTVEQVLPVIRQILEAGGFPVASMDADTGRIETAWGAEFPGSTHGWMLRRWTERQKFIAIVAPSQHQTEKGEPLVSVLLQLRWEERPPQGGWKVKEEGGAPTQSPVFGRFVRELEDQVTQLGGRRG